MHSRAAYWRAFAGAFVVLVIGTPAAQAQDTGVFRLNSEMGLPDSIMVGETINQIDVEGVPAGDPIAEKTKSAFGFQPGDVFDWLKLQAGLDAVRALAEVESARFVVERTSSPTRISVVIEVVAASQTEKSDFPILHRDADTLFTLIGNGAVGVYTDFNPWFGRSAAFTQFSPVAEHPPQSQSASWGEASVELGAGGVTRVGSSPLYLYGAATGMFTFAAGQDLFSDESRSLLRIEKLYAGFIIGKKGVPRSANISIGRQNFNLADGFLISQFSGSANAGPRPGLYLNPRIAFDVAALADLRFGKVRFKAFYLNPDELEDFESHTEFAGANLTYTPSPGTRLGGTFIKTVRSDTLFRTPFGRSIEREGVNTLAIEGRAENPFGITGLWGQSEYAWQWRGEEMRSWAGYATLGWRWRSGWEPSLSYRFAAFSGDDPETDRFERYDPLLSGGLAEWVQGISFKKVVGNSNMNVHRVRITSKLAQNLNVTLDYFNFEARERNNIGGNPALRALDSIDIGQEFTLRADWFATERIYVLIVASRAMPGEAIDAAVPGKAKPWSSLQFSAFWHF